MFYFTLLIIEPKNDEEKVSNKELSLEELRHFSTYLEEQTAKGIPVKARIGVHNKEGKKETSITINTKNSTETDIIKILSGRISNPQILSYLSGKEEEKRNYSKVNRNSLDSKIEQNEENNLSAKQEKEDSILEEQLVKTEPKIERTVIRKADRKVKPIEFCNKKLMILGSVLGLLLLSVCFSFWKISTLKSDINRLNTVVENQSMLLENQPKIDTKSRFFLASYFGKAKDENQYKDGLKKYVSISTSNWKRPSGEVKSMFLYSLEKKRKEINVKYIITLEEDETTKVKQISFDVKEKKHKIVVVSEPKIDDFSW